MENAINLVEFGTHSSNHENKIEDYSLTRIDLLWFLISIVLRPISIFLNISLALDYYNSGNKNYYIWTLCCMIIPIMVTTLLHFYMHYEDEKGNKNLIHNKWYSIILHVVILPFLLRYWHSFYYAIRSKTAKNKLDQKRFYEYMVQTDSDVALIRIFDCFLEIAPQKTLQIAIMIPFKHITRSQILSVGGLIISSSWCIASYQRCIRFARTDKRNVSIYGTIVHLLWQSFITTSRILSIALVANIFPLWTLLACFAHAMIMTIWLFFFDRSPFCGRNIFLSFIFSFLLGIVYIFNYILPKEGRTLYRYIFFYIITGLENFTCIMLSIYFSESIFTCYLLSIIIITTFIIGLLFMCSYYKFCHPNVTNS